MLGRCSFYFSSFQTGEGLTTRIFPLHPSLSQTISPNIPNIFLNNPSIIHPSGLPVLPWFPFTIISPLSSLNCPFVRYFFSRHMSKSSQTILSRFHDYVLSMTQSHHTSPLWQPNSKTFIFSSSFPIFNVQHSDPLLTSQRSIKFPFYIGSFLTISSAVPSFSWTTRPKYSNHSILFLIRRSASLTLWSLARLPLSPRHQTWTLVTNQQQFLKRRRVFFYVHLRPNEIRGRFVLS